MRHRRIDIKYQRWTQFFLLVPGELSSNHIPAWGCIMIPRTNWGLPWGLSSKESACNADRFDPWVEGDPLEEGMTTRSSIFA